MDITKEYRKQQEAKRLRNRISSFIDDFKIGTILDSSDKCTANNISNIYTG